MSQNSGGHIVPWPVREAEGALPLSRNETPIRVRLDGVLAALRAAEAGEFLAAVPECPVAQMQYRTTINLLGLAERELMEICRSLCD